MRVRKIDTKLTRGSSYGVDGYFYLSPPCNQLIVTTRLLRSSSFVLGRRRPPLSSFLSQNLLHLVTINQSQANTSCLDHGSRTLMFQAFLDCFCCTIHVARHAKCASQASISTTTPTDAKAQRIHLHTTDSYML